MPRPASLLALVLAVACSACSGSAADRAGSGPPGATASPTPTGAGVPILPGTPVTPPSGVLPACEYPDEIRTPDWVPQDLVLPEGTYAFELLQKAGDYFRAKFVVPATLPELTTLVLERWPEQGYLLGRGEAEPGEIENYFTKPPSAGAFKAVDAFCEPGYTVMLLIFAPTLSTPTP